eukprot:COSAG04_NODE_9266_length_880_cov_2.833504_2_plen_105_part_01
MPNLHATYSSESTQGKQQASGSAVGEIVPLVEANPVGPGGGGAQEYGADLQAKAERQVEETERRRKQWLAQRDAAEAAREVDMPITSLTGGDPFVVRIALGEPVQ